MKKTNEQASQPMTKREAGTLNVTGRHVTYFVTSCKSLAEAQRSIPELTQEQYDSIQSGKAAIHGDSHSGLEYGPLEEDA